VFGEIVRGHRGRLGVTQEKLAERTRITSFLRSCSSNNPRCTRCIGWNASGTTLGLDPHPPLLAGAGRPGQHTAKFAVLVRLDTRAWSPIRIGALLPTATDSTRSPRA